MKRALPGAIVLLALCTLRARGADPDPAPTQIEIHTLTRIDAFPTKDEVLTATGTIARLSTLAMTETVDFGLQLRAIRALPHFCTPDCKPNIAGQNHEAHDAVLAVIGSVPADDRTGRGILRLRAGIEALGLIRSGKDSDVTLLVPFLDDASRDIRAATARALRSTCNTLAIAPLRNRYTSEQVKQVKLALESAIRDLSQCPPAS